MASGFSRATLLRGLSAHRNFDLKAPSVDLQQKLAAVLELAERLGIEVRRAPLGGDGGGICILKGRKVLFVDVEADMLTRCERSLSELARLPEIDSVYVAPELREQIDRYRTEASE